MLVGGTLEQWVGHNSTAGMKQKYYPAAKQNAAKCTKAER